MMLVYKAPKPGNPDLRTCTTILSPTRTRFNPAHASLGQTAITCGEILDHFRLSGPSIRHVTASQLRGIERATLRLASPTLFNQSVT